MNHLQLKILKFKSQSGLSLVELMVTLVLSLFIMLVTTGFYINNKSTYRFIDSSSDVQENGRYAIHFLRENIANAGFPKDIVDPFPAGASTNGAVSDQIAVSYQATEDCLGIDSGLGGIITSTFAVNAGSLECNGTPLIAGVENLQIEYGVDTDTGLDIDGIPNTYQTAAQVTAAANWNDVVVVRLAILIASQNPVRDQASIVTYQLLGTTITAPNDRLHRRVFTTTIPLRNRVL